MPFFEIGNAKTQLDVGMGEKIFIVDLPLPPIGTDVVAAILCHDSEKHGISEMDGTHLGICIDFDSHFADWKILATGVWLDKRQTFLKL